MVDCTLPIYKPPVNKNTKEKSSDQANDVVYSRPDEWWGAIKKLEDILHLTKLYWLHFLASMAPLLNQVLILWVI